MPIEHAPYFVRSAAGKQLRLLVLTLLLTTSQIVKYPLDSAYRYAQASERGDQTLPGCGERNQSVGGRRRGGPVAQFRGSARIV